MPRVEEKSGQEEPWSCNGFKHQSEKWMGGRASEPASVGPNACSLSKQTFHTAVWPWVGSSDKYPRTEVILSLSRRKMCRNNHRIKGKVQTEEGAQHRSVEAGAAEYDRMERSPGTKGPVGSEGGRHFHRPSQ